jgi:hypothetical protein
VAIQGPVFATVRAGHQSWRFAAIGNGQAVFLARLSLADMESDLRRSRNAFLVAVPVLLAVLFAAGWVLAGRASDRSGRLRRRQPGSRPTGYPIVCRRAGPPASSGN